jgi:hypothetical protein
MSAQPDFPYRVEFNLEVAIDRNDDGAFDIVRAEVLALGDGEPTGIANATVYRIRPYAAHDYVGAAVELDESDLLEDVCQNAIELDTGMIAEVYRETLDAVSGDVLVLDHIEFISIADDTAVLRGLIARCVLDTLGRGEEFLFLPSKGSNHGELWERAVGATRVGHFWVASASFERPAFPLEVVD